MLAWFSPLQFLLLLAAIPAVSWTAMFLRLSADLPLDSLEAILRDPVAAYVAEELLYETLLLWGSVLALPLLVRFVLARRPLGFLPAVVLAVINLSSRGYPEQELGIVTSGRELVLILMAGWTILRVAFPAPPPAQPGQPGQPGQPAPAQPWGPTLAALGLIIFLLGGEDLPELLTTLFTAVFVVVFAAFALRGRLPRLAQAAREARARAAERSQKTERRPGKTILNISSSRPRQEGKAAEPGNPVSGWPAALGRDPGAAAGQTERPARDPRFAYRPGTFAKKR